MAAAGVEILVPPGRKIRKVFKMKVVFDVEGRMMFLNYIVSILIGHGYQPIPSSGDYVEEENERMTDELKDKINVLKSLSIDIGAEVKYQDKMLKGLDDDFDKGQGVLGKTMNHVLRLSRGSHNYYLLYLILFSFLVLIILWVVIKYK